MPINPVGMGVPGGVMLLVEPVSQGYVSFLAEKAFFALEEPGIYINSKTGNNNSH